MRYWSIRCSFCSTSAARRATHVENLVISHERGEGLVKSHERGEESGTTTTTNEAYKWFISLHVNIDISDSYKWFISLYAYIDISDSTVYIVPFKVK